MAALAAFGFNADADRSVTHHHLNGRPTEALFPRGFSVLTPTLHYTQSSQPQQPAASPSPRSDMGAEETSSTAEPPHQQQRAAASSPSTHRRLALVPISLDVRVDAKTGLTVPPILLPSVDNGEGGGEVRLSKADVARTFVAQDGDKLGFVSREHVLVS